MVRVQTAFWGYPLIPVTLSLLYLFVLYDSSKLLGALIIGGNPMFTQFEDNGVTLIIHLTIVLTSCVIFIATLLAIRGKKISSLKLTKAAAVILLVDVFFTSYVLIRLNCGNVDGEVGLVSMYRDVVEIALGVKFPPATMSYYSTFANVFNVLWIIGLVFQVYSALVIRSCDLELKNEFFQLTYEC